MGFQTIDDIFAANDQIRSRFLSLIKGLSAEDEKLLTEKGDWTVGMVVEHVASVESSMVRICMKLLVGAKQQGKMFDGKIRVSPHFIEASTRAREEQIKFNAPEIVQPKGGKPVAESIVDLENSHAAFLKIKPLFEEADGTALTFPHPAFGDLTAIDWLVLAGGHEVRHTGQIEKILSHKNAAKA